MITGSHEPSRSQPSRRGFIGLLGRALLAVWGIGTLFGIVRFIRPPRDHHRPDEMVVPANTIEKLRTGGAILLPHDPDPIHLVRISDTEFLATSASCTHRKCILDFDEKEQAFICPCHRGQFDRNGIVVAGLPRRPLRRYPAVYRFGKVVINTRG